MNANNKFHGHYGIIFRTYNIILPYIYYSIILFNVMYAIYFLTRDPMRDQTMEVRVTRRSLQVYTWYIMYVCIARVANFYKLVSFSIEKIYYKTYRMSRSYTCIIHFFYFVIVHILVSNDGQNVIQVIIRIIFLKLFE